MKTHKNIFWIGALLGVLALTSFIASDQFVLIKNDAVLLKQLSDLSAKTNSISSKFTQEKYMAVFTTPQVSNGSFHYQKNDKVRWEQVKPNSFVILINGETVRIKDNGVEKKIKSNGRVVAFAKDMLLGIVNGDYQKSKAFKITSFESSMEYKLAMLPTVDRIGKMFTSIELRFSKETLRLKSITFFETNGDHEKMIFTEVKYNSPLDQKLFNTL